MINPIHKFNSYLLAESLQSDKMSAYSCCLSTVGNDDCPNARMVSLKDVIEDRLVISGSLSARKGKELDVTPKAALTFWWLNSKTQGRMQGNMKKVDKELSDTLFRQRSLESKVTTLVSNTGEQLISYNNLLETFNATLQVVSEEKIERPSTWSGLFFIPFRIEFMKFNHNRFHYREYYELCGVEWKKSLLQP